MIVDFVPLLNYLATDFKKDNISQYFIPPSFDVSDEEKSDLHKYITAWLESSDAKPVARSRSLGIYVCIIFYFTGIKIVSRDLSVMFDFGEFTTVALSFIGTSCAVFDVLVSMRKTYSIPGNDLLTLLDDSSERALLGELLRKGGDLQVIPSL